MTADLTAPLSSVPVGAYVVHEGRAKRIDHRYPDASRLVYDGKADLVLNSTLVLHLDGDAPRPLRECGPHDVWLPVNDTIVRWEARQHWNPAADDVLAWPIVVPQHGYRIVDVQALYVAIEWLKGWRLASRCADDA